MIEDENCLNQISN